MVYNPCEPILNEMILSFKSSTEDAVYNYRSLLSHGIRCTANSVHRVWCSSSKAPAYHSGRPMPVVRLTKAGISNLSLDK